MAPKEPSQLSSPFIALVAGITAGSLGTLLTLRRSSFRQKRQTSADALAQENFKLASGLSQGNVEIGKLPLSQVLLCDDARFEGWLILVPRKRELKTYGICTSAEALKATQEIIDLPEDGQELLWKEVAAALRVIQKAFKIDKLNVSAIGNICPQLHIHVTGRTFRDAAWPNVHLGLKGRIPHRPEELQKIRHAVIQGFKSDGKFTLLTEEDEIVKDASKNFPKTISKKHIIE